MRPVGGVVFATAAVCRPGESAALRTTEDVPAGFFFLLCTPLLPFDELERWTASREPTRSRLTHLLRRPDVREALVLASSSLIPELGPVLEARRRDPDGDPGDEVRRIESALVRLLARMATATTPSGLSAGFSVGVAGPETRLELEGEASHRRRTRLDVDDLFLVARSLSRDPRLRGLLRHRPNSSLYRVGDRLRYYADRVENGLRLYDLVAVETDEVLEAVLARAGREEGATLDELTRTLLDEAIEDAGDENEGDEDEGDDDEGGEDGVTTAEVEAFLGELVDAGILVPELTPPVTGPEPLDALIADLEPVPRAAPATARLRTIRAALAELDAGGSEVAPEIHRRLACELGSLLPEEHRSQTPPRLHVDLVKTARATLGPEVLAEVERAVGLLDRLPRQPVKPLLAHFAGRFRERWGEGRELPLTEVLDEDTGIGFGLDRRLRETLADGAHLRQPPPPWLREKVESAVEEGRWEVRIPEAELEAAPRHEVAGDLPLTDAFHLRVRLAARSGEALAAGRFRLGLLGLAGPSGARLLGRLCHADETLRRRVETHLAAEEALDPDAVFAEIVHLPEGRPGNRITRPRLRRWEIPFLGRGGAGADHRIPVTDLRVGVEDGRIVLRSERLGRRVIPRQTASHFIGGSHQPLYRFLGALQDEGVRGGWSWHWGSLDGEPFLPRVTSGRLVLALARWRVPVSELETLAATRGAGGGGHGERAVRAWRSERRLPRRVVLDDPDGEWVVDLDHPLVVDALLARAVEMHGGGATPGRRVLLTELFPGPDELCVRGPGGRFLHELVLPWVRGSLGR